MNKSYPFFLDKIKTRASMKNLRHASLLKTNLKNTHRTFQLNYVYSKRDIDVQKIKVKKLH